jgi:hypothetical protein
MNQASGPSRTGAMFNVLGVSSVNEQGAIDQPTMRRLKASKHDCEGAPMPLIR